MYEKSTTGTTQTQIPAALDGLEHAIGVLEKEFETLSARLAPIKKLSPVDAVPKPENNGLCELANTIVAKTEKIDRIRQNIEYLIECLQI